MVFLEHTRDDLPVACLPCSPGRRLHSDRANPAGQGVEDIPCEPFITAIREQTVCTETDVSGDHHRARADRRDRRLIRIRECDFDRRCRTVQLARGPVGDRTHAGENWMRGEVREGGVELSQGGHTTSRTERLGDGMDVGVRRIGVLAHDENALALRHEALDGCDF